MGHSYEWATGTHVIFENVNAIIRKGERIGILGRNGSGKSTLIRLLSGAEKPRHGTIVRSMSVSWPLAFGGAFHGALSGVDNVRFIAKVYDAPYRDVLNKVIEFAELGDAMQEPVKKYSSGMAARLAFGLSLAIEFDCYLIDEVIAVGDGRFAEKCRKELFVKRSDRAYVLVSHSDSLVSEVCSAAYVLREGHLEKYDAVPLALKAYHEL